MRTRLLSIVVLALCIAITGCQVSPVQKGGLIGGAVGAANQPALLDWADLATSDSDAQSQHHNT